MYSSPLIYGSAKKWYQVWWTVWTRPEKTTYLDVLKDPYGGVKRGIIWLVLTGIISGILEGLLNTNLDDPFPVCAFMTTPVFSIIEVSILATALHFFSQVFKGDGNWEQLFYLFSTIQAPLSILFPLFIIARFQILEIININEVHASFLLLFIIGFCILALAYSIFLMFYSFQIVEKINIINSILCFLFVFFIIIGLYICLLLPAMRLYSGGLAY